MGALAEEMLGVLNCETVFVIPILGGIEVMESVAATWIIMAILVVVAIFLTSNLKVENVGKKQMIVETAVEGLQNMIVGIIGEKGIKYVPYLVTVIIFIALSNMMGIIGFKPPTKDLNVTAGLAIMSIILIEYAAISSKGVKHWLKHFIEPVPVVMPINVLELFIRPLSLCMRLFGNILGAFVVMELLKIVAPAIIPIPFSLYFDIFDGLIQAFNITFY